MRDNQQVNPSAIREVAIYTEHHIEGFLRDAPLKELYHGKLSIYDIAKESFSAGALTLKERFRCVPDIRFGSALRYNGAITALREVLPTHPAPTVVAQCGFRRTSPRESTKMSESPSPRS